MRVTTTSIAVCVLVGSVAVASAAEARDRAAPSASRPAGKALSHASSALRGNPRAVAPHFAASHRGASHFAARHGGNRHAPRGRNAFAVPGADWSVALAGGGYASVAYASPTQSGITPSGTTPSGIGYAGGSYSGGRPGGGISCVPYAREISGIDVRGNARAWWHEAQGRYDRGQRPEAGSVMAFRASGGMARGHVAVVSKVISQRHVLIDHANWSGPGLRKGSIMHNVHVVDVSDANDWTAVRVQVGFDEGNFGRTYPTYGFIYNRPDRDTAYAGGELRRTLRMEQVAEMPAGGGPTTYQPTEMDWLRRR